MSTEDCGCESNPCECKIPAHLIRKWERAAERLNAVMREIVAEVPTAQAYLACDVLHLMTGDSHEGYRSTTRQDRSRIDVKMTAMDGGDW